MLGTSEAWHLDTAVLCQRALCNRTVFVMTVLNCVLDDPSHSSSSLQDEPSHSSSSFFIAAVVGFLHREPTRQQYGCMQAEIPVTCGDITRYVYKYTCS